MFEPGLLHPPFETGIDFMRDLVRQIVKGQSGDEANHSFGHPQGNRNEIRISQWREIRQSVEPTTESLDHSGISHLIERSRVNALPDRVTRPEDPIVIPEGQHCFPEPVLFSSRNGIRIPAFHTI